MGLLQDRSALRTLRSSSATVPEIIAIISNTTFDPDVRTEAIRHPACTLPALRPVLDVGSEGVVDRIAMDSQDPDVLAYIVRTGTSHRRAIVAYNADTPPWLLAELASDVDAVVRQNVHVNPATPPEAVAALETDGVDCVRTAREDWWPYFEESSHSLRARAWRCWLDLHSRARQWRL